MGTKVDESRTGHVWAAGFHGLFLLGMHFELMCHVFVQFSNFLLGCGKPQTTETAHTESMDTAARLYFE
jgi:hypothetical protein